jgi:hypothetical protein
MAEAVWSVPVRAAEVPEAGLHVELEAPESVRVALADLAGLRTLSDFSAVFDVVPRRQGLRVTGRVQARAGQTCVVTLEPIENSIDEHVDLLFLPGAQDPMAEGESDAGLPEPLVDGRIDLGAIATEFLVLGIDPYPRKPDAVFEPPVIGTEEAHPFAALAALKNKPGGN